MMLFRYTNASTARALLAGAALIALASPSFAAPVVMLQFGSFESKAEADQRLASMKSKHAGILGDMPSFVREVKTPYGSTVYRTQVGPVAGRPQAQSICAQLVSNGDSECYIVESAMPQTPTTQVAQEPSKQAPALVEAKPKEVAQAKPTQAEMPAIKAPADVKAAPAETKPSATMMDGKRAPVSAVTKEASLAKPAIKDGMQEKTELVKAPATNVVGVAKPSSQTPATSAAQEQGSISALYDKVASPEAREPITDTAKAIKQGSTQTVASTAKRDPQTANMLASVGSAQPHPATAPLVVTKPQGSGEAVAAPNDASMEAALAQAAQNQPQKLRVRTPQNVEEATKESAWYDSINPFSDEDEPTKPKAMAAASNEEESSFFDSINPFSDSPADKAKKTVAQTAPVQKAADSTPLQVKPSVATPTQAAAIEQPVASVAQTASAPVISAAAPDMVANPLAMPAVTPPSQMRLPPPPVPESEAQREALARQIAQQPVNIQAPVSASVPANAPIASAPLEAPSIPKGTSIAEAAKIMDAHNVRVEEARRVPLTDDAMMEPAPTPPVTASSAPVSVAPADMPSQTSYNRTLWGHISYFDNAQKALAFWDGFRKANPDFPSVRVRVTSPYVAREQGNGLVSLRVGPFGSQAFVNELCESDAVSRSDYTCRSVTDMGSAASSNQPRMVQPVGLSSGRYGRSGTGMQAREGVWVQLGAFASQEQAESSWQAMKLKHPSALRAMKAQLSTPPQGSHETPVFRLRVGPFLGQAAAEETCLRLKSDGSQCLVVNEQ